MTLAEVERLPALVSLRVSADALGLSLSAAKALHGRGDYPVPVLRVGRLLKVRSVDLVAYLAN